MKRRLWQLTSTVLHNIYFPAVANITIYQGFLKSYCTSTLNCYACPLAVCSCPIGSLQHFAIRHQFPFFLAGFLGLVGMAVGRMTCGWLCPFGFLQDLIKKISKRVVPLPKWMGSLKYVSLIGIAIILPFLLGDPWFSKICPAGGIQGAIPWAVAGSSSAPELEGFDVRPMIGTMFWIKMAILGFFFMAMVLVKRPFCRTLCPLGAVLSLFNKISIVRLHLDDHACTECGFCRDICPVDLNVNREIDSPECIKCLECLKCPEAAITVKSALRSRR